MMAAKSEVGLDKEPQSGSGSSGDHALGASPEPITLETMDFVASFPEELTDMILSHLTASDLEYCSGVSQIWSKAIKIFKQRQYARLKYNWENGIYSVHRLSISDDFECAQVPTIELLPSNFNHDQCLYYPVFMAKKGTQSPLHFCVIRIDAELRKTIDFLFEICPPYYIENVCVMGGCLIWLESFGTVKYYNATLGSNSKVETFEKDNHAIPNDSSLTTDRDHIVVSNYRTNYLKVWCKQSHKPILESKCNKSSVQKISLCNGCLIISNSFKAGIKSAIEIHNLTNDANNTLKHTFTLACRVQNLHSNERFIFLNIEMHHNYIQVHDKQSYAIVYSHKYDSSKPCTIHYAYDDFIFVKEFLKNSYRILTLASGEWLTVSSLTKRLYTVFENISVNCPPFDNTLHVLDWKRDAELFTLAIPEPNKCDFSFSSTHDVVSVSEFRIVVFDLLSDKFIVYKFG
ncbi:uncharacterized protein LOC111058178 isoform X2 [Nilaparvata lugens]|uniref:uncharacterized protein LOC111058178 isoform X2 n=1 Tax=Nilaparvata lugens TaxID=108931 RepID=UPI000B98FBB9|nr:uncharacterized protein LOC111058178 isoform X2 [Nilaparvata lugens]